MNRWSTQHSAGRSRVVGKRSAFLGRMCTEPPGSAEPPCACCGCLAQTVFCVSIYIYVYIYIYIYIFFFPLHTHLCAVDKCFIQCSCITELSKCLEAFVEAEVSDFALRSAAWSLEPRKRVWQRLLGSEQGLGCWVRCLRFQGLGV